MSSTYNALAGAIAQEENSQWTNNPGALETTAGTHQQFPTLAAGQAALLNKLNYDASGNSSVYSPNMSLAQFESVYTGGDPNAANNVGSILGVPTSTTLAQLSDQSLNSNTANYGLDPYAINLPGSGSVSIAPNGTVTNAMSQGTQTAVASNVPGTGIVSQFETWLADSQANVAAVIVGMILIAGAVFSFSSIKDTVVSGAKMLA